jgi:hypothetical protein
MNTQATQRLHDMGQSLWLDNITGDLLSSGTLAGYTAELSVRKMDTRRPSQLRPQRRPARESIPTRLVLGPNRDRLHQDDEVARSVRTMSASEARPIAFQEIADAFHTGVCGWEARQDSRIESVVPLSHEHRGHAYPPELLDGG